MPASLPRHVLIVEGDATVQGTIATMLTDAGYLATAVSGGAGMRRLLAAGRVDLAIIDVTLSGETGEDLALYARELGIPCVMMSGNPAAVQRFAELGHQLLAKPFRLEALVAAVEEALGSGVAGPRTETGAAIGTPAERAGALERAAAYRRLAVSADDVHLCRELLTAAAALERFALRS